MVELTDLMDFWAYYTSLGDAMYEQPRSMAENQRLTFHRVVDSLNGLVNSYLHT